MPISTIRTGIEAVDRLQTTLVTEINKATSDKLLNRTIIDVVLGTGMTLVRHNLKREPQGFIVIRASNDAKVYSDIMDKDTITIASDKPVNVRLMLF